MRISQVIRSLAELIIKDHHLLDGLADDDHTQYQQEIEKGAASGYASLDASSLVVQNPATSYILLAEKAAASGVASLDAASLVVQNPATLKIVRKTADEIVNNSITLQNDDHLLLAMAANEVWAIRVVMIGTSVTATTDINVLATAPTGASGHALFERSPIAGGWVIVPTAFATTLSCDSPVAAVIIFNTLYIIINGATAGNFQMQWAQVNAVVEDTKILANSCIIAHKLA